MKREPIILGAADGAVIVLGLLLSLAVAGHGDAVWRAALGGGLAELVGMTAGVWLSDGRSGFAAALGCGVAACAACIAPALPYLVTSGTPALAASLALVAAAGVLIAWLRPEKGLLAAVQTFGVLVAAAALCGAAGMA